MAKKSSSHKKAAAKKSKHSKGYVSFKLMPNEHPFVQFIVTRQTLYWLFISLVILFLGLYVIQLQMQISDLYDQIDMTMSQLNSEKPVSMLKNS